MYNADVVLQFLRENELMWCDDCLSEKTEIIPRQQIYQVALKLAKKGMLSRNNGRCVGCGKIKITSSLNHSVSSTEKILTETTTNGPKLSVKNVIRPWYWEGNIQATLASYLAKEGYKIMAIANTASRENGKDIEAIMPDGKKLWISVKGWPEKSQNTQARHWFSQGMFDIILYRNESKDVELALAFPNSEGFPTYRNLAKRIKWFKDLAKFKIFWVSDNGTIQAE